MANGIGGRSFSSGIEFLANKYSIKFDSIDKDTAKVYLNKNMGEKIGKTLEMMSKYPILRSLAIMISNFKKVLLAFLSLLILEIVFSTFPETTQESSPFGSILTWLLLVPLNLLILSLLKIDFTKLGCTWKYHGAEHKVINTYIRGLDITYENCVKANRISDNCGTMFVVIYIIVLLVEVVLSKFVHIDLFMSIKGFIALIISCELFLVNRNNKILKPLFKIGYWAQEKIFTREPDDYQLIQAIETFKILIKAEKGKFTELELKELLSKEGKAIVV